MIRRLEHLPYADRLEKRLQGDIIAVFQYLQRAHKKTGEGLLSRACSVGQEGMASNWRMSGLEALEPREAVASPSLKVFKTRLERALNILV